MNNDKNSQAKDLNKTLGLAINENLKFKEARYAESTIGPYRRKSKQLVTWFGKKKLIDFSSTDIEMMVVKLLKKYNGCTVNHYLEILRSVFVREGANKRENSSRLTQSFHFFSLSRSFLP
ncbi:hypothetical protein KI797_12215 [Aeromonas media]|uniref:hypothetical protein n=1 Tax=Aeromonas media TaxID=651 RepID=UPI001CF471FE|nr:hypothetical protein [Aeromonas media]UCP13445.1 hypothetical protein KI797_12215 [Aeromonas media]